MIKNKKDTVDFSKKIFENLLKDNITFSDLSALCSDVFGIFNNFSNFHNSFFNRGIYNFTENNRRDFMEESLSEILKIFYCKRP